MKALWHILYWPALVLVGLLFIVNGLVSFLQFIVTDFAQFADKKRRRT
jgi:hypothetical protein